MNDDPLVLEMIADEVVKWERYRTGRPLALSTMNVAPLQTEWPDERKPERNDRSTVPERQFSIAETRLGRFTERAVTPRLYWKSP